MVGRKVEREDGEREGKIGRMRGLGGIGEEEKEKEGKEDGEEGGRECFMKINFIYLVFYDILILAIIYICIRFY